jgi:L-serine dehydratase
MAFNSVALLLKTVEQTKKPLWEVILEDDIIDRQVDRQSSMDHMKVLWETMKSADAAYNPKLQSASRLIGGDGAKMMDFVQSGSSIGGDFIGCVIATALKMGESNACMKRIVAAPTGGSCGVLPAVLIAYQAFNDVSDEQIIEAMYVAAGFGQIIEARACLSGAEGGCQAEIGSASAMAAATLVALRGGTASASGEACAMAFKNLMGLVCDPVAGLVEAPCIKRNVIGAVNAIASADMALAGIRSVIPADEVIDAMKEVGDAMPSSLRETGEGGIAGTKTGMEIARKLHEETEINP